MVLQGYQAEIPAKKLKRGHKKKFLAEFWLIFTKNRQKRGRRKFVYCILKSNLSQLSQLKIRNIFWIFSAAPFLPVFGKNQPKFGQKFFFFGPFWAFWPKFLPGNLATPFPELKFSVICLSGVCVSPLWPSETGFCPPPAQPELTENWEYLPAVPVRQQAGLLMPAIYIFPFPGKKLRQVKPFSDTISYYFSFVYLSKRLPCVHNVCLFRITTYWIKGSIFYLCYVIYHL